MVVLLLMTLSVECRYEMACLVPPFSATALAELMRQISSVMLPLSSIPSAYSPNVTRALVRLSIPSPAPPLDC